MGIINLTPDSFSDGGKFFDKTKAVKRAIEMEKLGVDFIDIGGQSTRPSYKRICAEEEWDRIKTVVKRIKEHVKVPVSVDTFYEKVARLAVQEGADIINDVSGNLDNDMLGLVKETSCGYIIMSNRSLQKTKSFFDDTLKILKENEIDTELVCFDPGIGFGKTYDEDLEILRHTNLYCPKGYPILVGSSRKRVVGKSCGELDPLKRVSGTISAHTISIMSGANIIRVHDVEEAIQSVRMVDAILNNNLVRCEYG